MSSKKQRIAERKAARAATQKQKQANKPKATPVSMKEYKASEDKVRKWKRAQTIGGDTTVDDQGWFRGANSTHLNCVLEKKDRALRVMWGKVSARDRVKARDKVQEKKAVKTLEIPVPEGSVFYLNRQTMNICMVPFTNRGGTNQYGQRTCERGLVLDGCSLSGIVEFYVTHSTNEEVHSLGSKWLEFYNRFADLQLDLIGAEFCRLTSYMGTESQLEEATWCLNEIKEIRTLMQSFNADGKIDLA